MRSWLPRAGVLLAALTVPFGCGGSDTLFHGDADTSPDFLQGGPGVPTTVKQAQFSASFPGAGTSGAAAPLIVGLGPDTSTSCDPTPAPGAIAETPVQHVCFFSKDDPTQLAANIQQVVEVVGTERWVHLRLTLSPDFVDNTYGQNAIGWGESDDALGAPAPGAGGPADGKGPPPQAPGAGPGKAGAPDAPPPGDAAGPPAPPPVAAGDAGPPGDAPTPPSPPAADGTAPPPSPAAGAGPGAPDAGPGRTGPAAHDPAPHGPGGPGSDPQGGPAKGPGAHGHTFRDLLESDHAEIQLLDAAGQVAMSFSLDYLSASSQAPSGYAALGVSGGEGRLSIGDPTWILASTSSLDRNLNACGLGSFVTDSPETDASYTPNPAATDWDYRVSYEVWVSTDAFGNAGFGSALIGLVHASPSKQGGASVNVLPAPCPTDPDDSTATPEPLPPVLDTIR